MTYAYSVKVLACCYKNSPVTGNELKLSPLLVTAGRIGSLHGLRQYDWETAEWRQYNSASPSLLNTALSHTRVALVSLWALPSFVRAEIYFIDVLTDNHSQVIMRMIIN